MNLNTMRCLSHQQSLLLSTSILWASRWLSTDPALGEYIPGAPVNDEAKKRNGNLPGMGGIYNTINAHLYHYAGNNPVKYTDPDGRILTPSPLQALIGVGVVITNIRAGIAIANIVLTEANKFIQSHYEKADQSGNPLTVKDALKAGFKPLSPGQAAWHRQGKGNEYNIKMVHEDGREAIYNKDGNLVVDDKNLGTKNTHPAENIIGHAGSDVGPYLLLGNTKEDKPLTGALQRIEAGGIHLLDIPKDYYQHWDEIYHPENYE